jgi:SAM-dependent methyltransferase
VESGAIAANDPALRLQELADLATPFAIRAACDLRLADHLAAGPRPVEELAAATGTDAGALRRLLRALAARGVFAEVETGCFGLTPLSELLTSRHPLSRRGAYTLLAASFDAWSRLDHSLRTGRPAFEHHFGLRYHEHLADTPEDAERFAGTQQAGERLEARALLGAYPWAELDTVVDVGGGTGTFLAALLARHRSLRGMLVELPHLAARAARELERAGVSERSQVVAGDFLQDLPVGAGGYVLKRVLVECEDDLAAHLLARVRRALPAEGRLLVLDPVLEPGDGYRPSQAYDLVCLVLTGGRARRREEIERLLRDAGLEPTAFVPTRVFPIIEARPA